MEKVNESLRIELKTTDLFNYSTIHELTVYISETFKNNIKMELTADTQTVVDLSDQLSVNIPDENADSSTETEEDQEILNLFEKLAQGKIDVHIAKKLLIGSRFGEL